jgi:hypothetical protein
MGRSPSKFARTIVTGPLTVNPSAKPMFSNPDSIEYAVTAGGLAVGLALAGVAVFVERNPRKSFNPRLVPTTPLMFAGVFVSLIALIHFVNLWGIKTGR